MIDTGCDMSIIIDTSVEISMQHVRIMLRDVVARLCSYVFDF